MVNNIKSKPDTHTWYTCHRSIWQCIWKVYNNIIAIKWKQNERWLSWCFCYRWFDSDVNELSIINFCDGRICYIVIGKVMAYYTSRADKGYWQIINNAKWLKSIQFTIFKDYNIDNGNEIKFKVKLIRCLKMMSCAHS